MVCLCDVATLEQSSRSGITVAIHYNTQGMNLHGNIWIESQLLKRSFGFIHTTTMTSTTITDVTMEHPEQCL